MPTRTTRSPDPAEPWFGGLRRCYTGGERRIRADSTEGIACASSIVEACGSPFLPPSWRPSSSVRQRRCAGNNGTLKIHELGTPAGTPNNDPKVCSFNVEAFNLDPGQSGYLVFSVQGGDAPQGTEAGPFAVGPADANGYFASQPFSPPAGHYKATLYGKADLTDVKAKSKVFKVTCDEGAWPGDDNQPPE